MIGPVVGHVGTRVSALVDGQLPTDVADRLWSHVHGCPLCRDQVEREGWVKTRVAGLCHQSRPTPDYLASLLTLDPAVFGDHDRVSLPAAHRRRTAVAMVVGAGSVSAAVLGVLAITGPAVAPPPAERRAPVASLTGVPDQSVPMPVRLPTTVAEVFVPAVLGALRTFLGPELAKEWVTINP